MKKLVLTAFLAGAVVFAWSLMAKETGNRQPAKPLGKTIVCFGDSLTFGTGAVRGMDYPAQLARMIPAAVINAGLPGETTQSALTRLQRDVLSHGPQAVLITLGGNDLKNGASRTQAFANLQQIVQRIQASGAVVIVGGIDIPFYDRGFKAGYQELARQTGAILIPDIYQGIMDHRSRMSDAIHPNAEGYRVMAEAFFRQLENLW
jgi:lysophospholipase L1-like esterase